VVDAKTVKEICPYLSQEVIGASWCPTDGHANPMITTLAYYKRAIEMGVRFFTDAKVTKLEKYKGKLRKVVMQSGEVFEAEKIIVAAGYESRYLARTVGVDVPLWRYFEEALVTELQPHMFDIMLGCADGDFYGHQTKHGSFVFGSDSGLEDGTDMDLDDMKTSSVTVSAGCRAVMGYIPLLADAKIVRTWGGWIDMCHDGVPVISEVEEVPGMILACGFTGHGFGTAPAVGLMLAQMVLGEKTVVDISALGYDRFKPVR
jgi:sarcosine oxidase subunit beta